MSAAEILQAQLLLAAAHRVVTQAREVRADLAAEHHTEALAGLATLRTEIRALERLAEELDTAIGVLAHRECLTCDGERAPGRLQCHACAAETATLTPTVEAALRARTPAISPTWPPRRS